MRAPARWLARHKCIKSVESPSERSIIADAETAPRQPAAELDGGASGSNAGSQELLPAAFATRQPSENRFRKPCCAAPECDPLTNMASPAAQPATPAHGVPGSITSPITAP